MMEKIKYLFVALFAMSLFSSCSSSDSDEVSRKSLDSYVVEHCAYERDAFRGLNFRTRAEIEDFLLIYADSYYREFGEELDWERDGLVNLLRSYDSRFFRDRGIIMKCFANSSKLHHKVGGVYVDAETDALNIDLITQIYSEQEEYAYIIVECTHSDLKRDVFWNLDFRYYDN